MELKDASDVLLRAMDQLTALYDQLVDEDMTDYQKVKAIYEGVMARTDYNNAVFHKYQGSSDWDAMLSGRHLRGRAALPRPAGLPLRQKTRWSNPARFFSFAIPGSAGGPSPFSSGTTRS